MVREIALSEELGVGVLTTWNASISSNTLIRVFLYATLFVETTDKHFTLSVKITSVY